MFIRNLYDSVEAFIERLEEDKAVPPVHIIRTDLYWLHLDRAVGVLRLELACWKNANQARPMRPSDLTEDAFDLVCELLKKASWCAFMPTDPRQDYASSGVVIAGEPVGESGVVSVAEQASFVPIEAASLKGQSS